MKSLGAKIGLLTVGVLAAFPAFAGIPVIDGSNLSQNVVTALQSVAMAMKQVEQYRIQLQQYQNMLQNTAAPSTNTWDEAQTTMTQLNSTINSLEYYRNQLGSIDNYLARFPDTAAYMNSPCYSPSGCSPAQWTAMADSRILGDQSQKRATDALFRGLDMQQKNMVKDATTLQRLQGSAQSAQGQVEAIGYANQLASHMANQLLQIRGLLIAQQNVIATRDQAQANKEAQEAAAAAQLRKGTFRNPPAKGYGIGP